MPESVELPYEYYRDNVAKSLELFDELALAVVESAHMCG